MTKILVTENDTTLEDLIQLVMPTSTIVMQRGLLNASAVKNPDEIEGLYVTVRSPVTKADMDELPNLRIITTGSAGYDHIDSQEAVSRGITVCNVARYGPAVAEFNMALMLALTRKVHCAHLQTLQRDFTIDGLRGRNLAGKTLGIVGTGNIGLYVAKLAKAFSMSVIAMDPVPNLEAGIEYVELDVILTRSDIIAICCPLLESTHHLFGRVEFKKMKRGVLIVNTSRGAVIDTQALVWALDQGIVAGAALDVLEGEVLLPTGTLTAVLGENPTSEQTQTVAEDLALIRHPKVIVTPHIAFYTEDSIRSIQEQTAENFRSFFAGAPTNTVATPIPQAQVT